MYKLDIILYSDIGCEIGRISVESEDEILKAIAISNWIISEGDKIIIESAWHEI